MENVNKTVESLELEDLPERTTDLYDPYKVLPLAGSLPSEPLPPPPTNTEEAKSKMADNENGSFKMHDPETFDGTKKEARSFL